MTGSTSLPRQNVSMDIRNHHLGIRNSHVGIDRQFCLGESY
jgi:hypothetical protein